MGHWARRHRRWAVTALMMAAVAAGSTFGGMAWASTGGSNPDTGVMYAVGTAAQRTALAFWTPARMAAATPAPNPNGITAGPAVGPPRGTPTARLFNGVPTVGALFFTNGTALHFCTASAVDSTTEDLVLTAAHCVSGSQAKNIEYVPGYHAGHAPYGAWVVNEIFVAPGWVHGQNQNLDFAFLEVTPPPGRRQLQRVTGGLQLGINRPYRRPIEAIGYNNSDTRPVECATHSFEFEANQMEFYCHGYRDGTSGGPWIINYDSRNGTGVIFGVIGGFQQGGAFEWASYSAYFGRPAYLLYLLAERN